jgi:hypothetical protein
VKGTKRDLAERLGADGARSLIVAMSERERARARRRDVISPFTPLETCLAAMPEQWDLPPSLAPTAAFLTLDIVWLDGVALTVNGMGLAEWVSSFHGAGR